MLLLKFIMLFSYNFWQISGLILFHFFYANKHIKQLDKINFTQGADYYCSDDIKLCCCRKHCVTDTSRPFRGSWSYWSGCVEPCRRREMTWTTGSASSRNRETKKHQPILKLNQWSLYPGRKRRMKMTMKKTMRRACHRMMGWRRRVSTKLPDHLNWTLHWQLGMKPLLLHQAAASLQRWRAHCRTEPAHRASEEGSYAPPPSITSHRNMRFLL